MLIVVENGNIKEVLQATFDFKAAGCGNIFEIDSAKTWSDQLHGADDLFSILGIKTDWPSINIGKTLEESGLSFHNWHGSFRSNIS